MKEKILYQKSRSVAEIPIKHRDKILNPKSPIRICGGGGMLEKSKIKN
jgi:hypothetical protein